MIQPGNWIKIEQQSMSNSEPLSISKAYVPCQVLFYDRGLYTIRLPDGLLKVIQRSDIVEAMPEEWAPEGYLSPTQLPEHPYPLLFASLAGSHAFGYATPESDYDVHGVHLLPLDHVLGLSGNGSETIERKCDEPVIEMVTHDLKKFIQLLLKGNGNVLEDLSSPYPIVTSPIHAELQKLSTGCITKRLANHYRGMAYTQQHKLASNEIKKLIHMYRCLLTGVHLMRTGLMEIDLAYLAEKYQYKAINSLIQWKRERQEMALSPLFVQSCLSEIESLQSRLEHEQELSHLPDEPTKATHEQLEALLIRTRRQAGMEE